MHADDPGADPNEVRLLRHDGQTALVLLPLVAKGETIGLIELTRDGPAFTERDTLLAFTFASEAAMALENARLYEQLHHQAFHDPLTRLANRSLFTDRLEHALARGGRLHARLAVLFIDVDDLKSVNDRLGHAKGDGVLAAVADRLRQCLRDADTAARIGGDEFAVLLEDLGDGEEAEVAARRILDVMSQPIAINDTLITDGRAALESARPAWGSRPRTSSCATPTSRCTRPRRWARAAWRCSGRACGQTHPSVGRSRRCSMVPSNGTSCASSINRWSRWRPAGSKAWRRWSAGTRRNAARACQGTSSPSPRRRA